MTLLGLVRRRRAAMPEVPVTGAVPPQFWHLFWSGPQGSEVSLPRDEEHIAATLIGGRDLSAEAWALRHVSTETLDVLAEARGYDSGDVCKLILSEMNSRASVTA